MRQLLNIHRLTRSSPLEKIQITNDCWIVPQTVVVHNTGKKYIELSNNTKAWEIVNSDTQNWKSMSISCTLSFLIGGTSNVITSIRSYKILTYNYNLTLCISIRAWSMMLNLLIIYHSTPLHLQLKLIGFTSATLHFHHDKNIPPSRIFSK